MLMVAAGKIRRKLGWHPRFRTLETIIATA